MNTRYSEKELNFADGTKMKLSLSVESPKTEYDFKRIETICKTAKKAIDEILTSLFLNDTTEEIKTLLEQS